MQGLDEKARVGRGQGCRSLPLRVHRAPRSTEQHPIQDMITYQQLVQLLLLSLVRWVLIASLEAVHVYMLHAL